MKYSNDPVNRALKRLMQKHDLSDAEAHRRLGIYTPAAIGNYRRGNREVPTDFILKWEKVFGEKLLEESKTAVDTNVSRETNVGLNVSARDIVESENYIGMHRRVYDTLEKNMDTHRILMMQMSETIKNLTGNQGGSPGGKQVSLPRE